MTRARDAATNSHGNNIPAGGASGQALVFASSGTATWGSAGTPFAGGYLAVTSDVTLTAGQSGYQIYVTGERLITLPAIDQSVYYIIKNGGTNNIYLKPHGSETMNGFATAIRLRVSAGSDMIIINDGVSNWQTISNTVGSTLAEATTITTSQTFTPKSITTALLVCVGGSSCGANSSQNVQNYMMSAGAGGSGYAEKFISSPASSYVVSIGTFGDVNGSAGTNTTAAGITCPPSAHFAARYTSSNGTTTFTGGAAGTGGDFSASGGNGAPIPTSGDTRRFGGGGGAGTRAGNGGNAGANNNGSSHSYTEGGSSGGTGGNNGADNSVTSGAAATAKASGSYVVSGVTSETYQAGVSFNAGGGGGAQTVMNWNGGTFTIAEGFTLSGTHGIKSNGHDLGQNNGAYGGKTGYVTFVEFF